MQQRARVTGRALALLAGRRSAGGVAGAPHPWAAPAAPSTTAADRPLAPRWASTAAPAARGGDEAPTLSTPPSAPFSLTPAAAARIRTLLARPASAAAGHTALRLTVEAGGCSGFSYVFGLDSTLQPGDVAVGAPDAPLVVDGVSLELVRGATVDFSSELIRQGFTVAGNPNAEGGCGCGSSFAPKA
jgi:iron-sulfur cluster assembly accessory protein